MLHTKEHWEPSLEGGEGGGWRLMKDMPEGRATIADFGCGSQAEADCKRAALCVNALKGVRNAPLQSVADRNLSRSGPGLQEMIGRYQGLLSAAKAVVARWDSTDWKAAPTADYIAALKTGIEAADLTQQDDLP